MKNIIIKKDVHKIIERYALGKLLSMMRIKRRHSHLQPAYIIKTTKGKYFLKQFKTFDDAKRNGLSLNMSLQTVKYPCNKVILSKNAKPYVTLNGKTVAIFAFLPYHQREEHITIKEYYALGEGLAKLHVMSKQYKYLKETYTPAYFYKEFRKNYSLSTKAPSNIKRMLQRIKTEYPKAVRNMEGLPKGICHTEFTPQHVRFHNQKLVAVIDWDLINMSCFLFDLGTTLSTVISPSSLQLKKMKAILQGYESVRKLTKAEREVLFEAVELGIFKFVTWGLDKEEIKVCGWRKIGIVQADLLMMMGKEKFDKTMN